MSSKSSRKNGPLPAQLFNINVMAMVMEQQAGVCCIRRGKCCCFLTSWHQDHHHIRRKNKAAPLPITLQHLQQSSAEVFIGC